jgi:hypothetical protein
MTIKLMLLKSGEDIISDIQEMVIGDPESDQKKVIGYLLKKPCVVKLRDGSLAIEDNKEKSKANAYSVTMYPWIPLTKDKVIPLTAEWVITLVNPDDQVLKMYEEDILPDGKNDKDFSSDEQPKTNKSNRRGGR